MIGFWAVAARHADSSGVDSLFVLRTLFTNNHRVARNADLGGVRMETLKERLDEVPETGDPRYEVKIEKAELRWDGHLAGEPAVGSVRQLTFIVRGKRNVLFHGRAILEPEWQQPIVGSLKIHGKGDLAKGLSGSPIRMQGPAFWAGSGSFEFYSDF